ncbi:hypothetical protein Poli38472_003821 [Pythium oligandrum]|uniref:Cytochrome P450 n=1 Tax=Pythium oligandrum TaxID=41045 RepID=A0A8K1CNV7_PYTOL|nr:hypothetical protein Poli38472_003821 [Pythium oligandrum]|eukprot:TMW66056.1 hypothetical protein Poli38472_003821 [Pythium oligandrum]
MERLMEWEGPNVPLLAAGTAIVAVALTVQALRQSQDAPRYRKIEQPDTTLPVLGNLVDLVRNAENLHDWVLENTMRFEGRPWKFVVPGQGETMVLSTPDALEEITSTQFKSFPKGPLQNELLGGIAADTLVTADGERWYHQRKTVVKFFSAKVLDMFVRQSIQKNIGRTHAMMEETIKAQQPVNLTDLFHDFTLDTFLEMGLGVDLKSIGATEKHSLHVAMEASSHAIFQRIGRPQWMWKLERWLNVGHEARLKSNVDKVYAGVHEIIQQSIEAMVHKKQSGEDTTNQTCMSVVELFLESPQSGEDGLTQDDFVGFILALVFAARDTTADTLVWLFYSLTKHPEIEKKLRDEMALELSGLSDDNSTYLTAEHLKSLVYLEAVIKETLRLYPAGALTLREAAEDTVICGDIFIRKGQQVMMPQFSVSRNKSVWGPDAAEFRPERWIDEATGKIKPVPPFKFFTFSAGPRICVGMNLAMMELRVVTANLLYRYRFELAGNVDGSSVAGLTLGLKDPLLVTPIAL